MSIRVFLADDHCVLREGVAALLRAEAGIEVVGQAGTAEEMVRACVETGPDVVLVDLTMPGGGLDAIGRLRAVRPDIRCIALTMHDDPAYLRAVLDAGGAGYVVKGVDAKELVVAVRSVAKGSGYFRVSLGEQAGSSPTVFEPSPLSPRERAVLILVARGFSNTEIGKRLDVTKKTVDSYRERMQQKLGLSGRVALVDYALKTGLLASTALERD